MMVETPAGALMVRTLVALSLLAASPALAAEPARALPREELPANLAPAVAKGDEAADMLRDRFLKRVTAMLAQGGPKAAFTVCPTEAPRIAKEVAALYKVEIGRTSFRLRNAANASRPWAASYVRDGAGKKPEELKPVFFDLGDEIGLLRPIVATPACTRCHGPEDALDPDVKALIAKQYPQDKGAGFSPGDLRGFIWVEVKKR
jgi:hypothetical protein